MVGIILLHNTHDRPKTMIDTLKAEQCLNADLSCISITSDGGLTEDAFNDYNALTVTIPGMYHQINCINAFYSLVSSVTKALPDGVIIFTHDDVPLVNEDVVKANIARLIDKDLSYIVRNPINFGEDNYFMMEVVYLRVKYIREAFDPFTVNKLKNVSEIPLDQFNKPSAETWLANTLKNIEQPGEVIKYTLIDNKYAVDHLESTMGYTHLNYGLREWKE